MFEFEFLFHNSQDPLYVTHHTNTIDNDLLQFLIQIEVDFLDIKQFNTTKLN